MFGVSTCSVSACRGLLLGDGLADDVDTAVGVEVEVGVGVGVGLGDVGLGDVVPPAVPPVVPPVAPPPPPPDEAVGLMVGDAVGLVVGDAVGLVVGDAVGLVVGDAVGLIVGEAVGDGDAAAPARVVVVVAAGPVLPATSVALASTVTVPSASDDRSRPVLNAPPDPATVDPVTGAADPGDVAVKATLAPGSVVPEIVLVGVADVLAVAAKPLTAGATVSFVTD
jgi:hypothetical protein